MAKINLKEPHGPYHATIDTGTMDIEIRDTFLGCGFVTESGERLSVSMRDNGFELRYTAGEGSSRMTRIISLQDGDDVERQTT